MTELEEFVDGISIHLGNSDTSNVPRTAIIFAARQAVKRFCDESLSYIVHAFDPLSDVDVRTPILGDITITRIGRQCQLAIPDNTHIIKIWQLSECDCIDDTHSYDYPNIISLPRDDADANDVVVSLSISQNAESCPDFIYHQYYDGILSGTIAYLQAMPNREWAMPNFAENHQAKFERSIMLARQAVDSGFKKSSNTSSIPASFI